MAGFKGGQYIVAFGLPMFAFTTIWDGHIMENDVHTFYFGNKVNKLYRILCISLRCNQFSRRFLKAVWDIVDTLDGLMAIPDLIGYCCFKVL